MFNHNQALVAIAAIITCVHLLFAISSAVLSINNLSIDYANAQSISAPPTGQSITNNTAAIMLALRRIANASN